MPNAYSHTQTHVSVVPQRLRSLEPKQNMSHTRRAICEYLWLVPACQFLLLARTAYTCTYIHTHHDPNSPIIHTNTTTKCNSSRPNSGEGFLRLAFILITFSCFLIPCGYGFAPVYALIHIGFSAGRCFMWWLRYFVCVSVNVLCR